MIKVTTEISAVASNTGIHLEWISVEDQLPEKRGRYLCWIEGQTTDQPNLQLLQYSIHDDEEEGSWITGSGTVTHWMQQPPPPENGSK
jgi:hypothetical protein